MYTIFSNFHKSLIAITSSFVSSFSSLAVPCSHLSHDCFWFLSILYTKHKQVPKRSCYKAAMFKIFLTLEDNDAVGIDNMHLFSIC